MPKPALRKIYKYSEEFKTTAVQLSNLQDVLIQDVAEALDIHPFMLSRWRKESQAMETIDITIDDADLDFNAARKDSDEIAERRLKEPLLVSWYDGVTGTGHPDVHECHDKPGWKTYAETRGGRLTVNVNAGRYILIYSETSLDDT